VLAKLILGRFTGMPDVDNVLAVFTRLAEMLVVIRLVCTRALCFCLLSALADRRAGYHVAACAQHIKHPIQDLAMRDTPMLSQVALLGNRKKRLDVRPEIIQYLPDRRDRRHLGPLHTHTRWIVLVSRYSLCHTTSIPQSGRSRIGAK
jgi:hypothetical protein